MPGDNKTGTNSPPATADDPFSQIAASPPAFSETWAREFLMRHYGTSASARQLVSERDQNFLMTEGDKPLGILKIANSSEPNDVTRIQIDALKHIAAVDGDLACVPRILLTSTGEDSTTETADGDAHIVRLVSYLPGIPASDAGRGSWSFARHLGEMLARLDLALRDFRHDGEAQTLIWDMQRALALRDLLRHIGDATTQALLARSLDDFERLALPAFDSLPRQVIHNDANPANVLLDEALTSRVTGIIDFGDMVLAPRIVELGVAGAYLRVLDGNPLRAICELIAGYHQTLPLDPAELKILLSLIRTRLATTIVILHWRQSLRDPADDYLRAAHALECSALSFLERLTEVSDAEAYRTFCECLSLTSRNRKD